MDKDKKTISLVINTDTRSGFMEEVSELSQSMQGGTKSIDFFIGGVYNKIKFFRDYNVEVTLYVDIHEPIPDVLHDEFKYMLENGMVENILLCKHTKHYGGNYYPKWLDLNILNAIVMSRSEYLVHCDWDTALFRRDSFDVVRYFITMIEGRKCDFISYPSIYSPDPVIDNDFEYWWASTRFFMCRRDAIDYTEIFKCLGSNEYLYGKYGEKNRKCPWLEHILGITSKNGVFYPPINNKEYLIFCWKRYMKGLFDRLNAFEYDQVKEYVAKCGGIQYPCDVRAI